MIASIVYAPLHLADIANRIDTVIDVKRADGGGIESVDGITVAADHLIDRLAVFERLEPLFDRLCHRLRSYPTMYPPASQLIDWPVIVRLSSLARNSAR